MISLDLRAFNASVFLFDLPLPLGISLNDGNGRPWIANAPNGASGYGTESVLDPQGFPLAGAPDPAADGVFAGNITNRTPGSSGGLVFAAVGTAIITKSPDLTGRAAGLGSGQGVANCTAMARAE